MPNRLFALRANSDVPRADSRMACAAVTDGKTLSALFKMCGFISSKKLTYIPPLLFIRAFLTFFKRFFGAVQCFVVRLRFHKYIHFIIFEFIRLIDYIFFFHKNTP